MPELFPFSNEQTERFNALIDDERRMDIARHIGCAAVDETPMRTYLVLTSEEIAQKRAERLTATATAAEYGATSLR